ncbi:hypothetical protein [Polynucleobacter yangtzensis]|uniref:Polysaccharide chain length determinant N-terminal domain-containing protein n=1 Tax=Polynucleobacter yangtzensis TaxID=1743159 RepID=A0ABM8CKU8_9BURK|nr:hypothetical protein [Polynucleobacter yangtzensis]BDT78437.1 hypothetical protein PKF032_03250 [Polynucleobacter yangtzensis]
MNNPNLNLQNPRDESLSAEGDQISLVSSLRFLRGAYKTMLITALIGSALSILYIMMTPNRYEAVAQIAMAQISAAGTGGNNINNNLNPLGINIEEPSLLISRLSSPTSFTPQVLKSCKLENMENLAAALAKSIKLTSPKGVSNIVELKTFGNSPQDAAACANEIFELIKTTQAEILAPYIDEAKTKLLDDEDRLTKAQNLVSKADKSGSAVGAAYLSTRDEIRFLLDEITSLKNVVTSNQSRATRLIAPIYASASPIAPKRSLILVVGMMGGLFLGLLIALSSKTFAGLKNDVEGIS